jgi:hypothetical protein
VARPTLFKNRPGFDNFQGKKAPDWSYGETRLVGKNTPIGTQNRVIGQRSFWGKNFDQSHRRRAVKTRRTLFAKFANKVHRLTGKISAPISQSGRAALPPLFVVDTQRTKSGRRAALPEQPDMPILINPFNRLHHLSPSAFFVAERTVRM